MSWWLSRRAVSSACLISCLAGCKAKTDAQPAAQSAATPAASASVAAPPVAKAKPWFSGGFQGQYEAKLAPVEIKTGAVREWKADDGKQASGPGKLTLQIDDDGLVDGEGQGALGASHASGKVEDDTLRVVLAPNETSGLRGVLVAGREGNGFRGSIQASTADSLTVRFASVELKKQAD